MRISTQENLAWSAVAFLSKCNVADTLVVWISPEIAEVLDIIEVLDVLLQTEVPEDIDVAVGALVAGEDVVVGDDDDLLAVPDLGILPELLLEDADGAGPADVVRHEHVDVHPHVLPGLQRRALRRPRQDLLRHRHRGLHRAGGRRGAGGARGRRDGAHAARLGPTARARAVRRRRGQLLLLGKGRGGLSGGGDGGSHAVAALGRAGGRSVEHPAGPAGGGGG